MKELKDKQPWVAIPLGWAYILTITLVFTPTLLFVFAQMPAFWTPLVLTTPALVLFLALPLTAFTRGNSELEWMYTTSTRAVDTIYNFRVLGWTNTLIRTATWTLATIITLGILQGITFWNILFSVIVLVLNYFIVGGRTSMLKSYTQPKTSTALKEELAEALVDFFAPASDFKVKPEGGVVYVDEPARVQKSLMHIQGLNEPAPGVYEVQLRNTTSQSDEKLMKEIEVVSSRLGWYDYRKTDLDPRAGFVSVQFWTVPKEDATSNPAGIIAWIPITTTGDK